MAPTHHALDHVELGATELAASRSFYEAAFGGRFPSYGPEHAGFHDPARSEEAGGLTSMLEAGGEVVAAPAPSPGGRRFGFADPGGNVLGVWVKR